MGNGLEYLERWDIGEDTNDVMFRPGTKRRFNDAEDNRPNGRERRKQRKLKLINTTQTENVEV